MYEVPGGDELREFFKTHGLTGSMAAGIVGVDTRTVRRWTASSEAPSRRAIPWSAWILLRLYVGTLTIEEYKGEVAPSRT